MKYSPIILLGAGRSGTNMLRDLLCRIPGVGTWPCDEINYIWRYGNARYPTDELKPEHVTERVVNYIHNAFEKQAKKQNLKYVVEKTCANTLRVEFVAKVLPEARYIHLIRDGRDVAASAAKRWSAPLEPAYIAMKAMYVPLSDIPYYGLRYFRNRLHRLFSKEKRLSTWGPRFDGLEALVNENPLPVACALQWKRCVTQAEEALDKLPPDRVYRLHYEDFVKEPSQQLQRLLSELAIPAGNVDIDALTQNVRRDSVGGCKKALSEDMASKVECSIVHTLQRFGYV